MNLLLPHGKDRLFPNKQRIIFTQISQRHIRPLGSAMVLIGKVVLCTLRRYAGKMRNSCNHYCLWQWMNVFGQLQAPTTLSPVEESLIIVEKKVVRISQPVWALAH